MYFRIKQDSETFEAVKNLRIKMKAATKAACDMATELGGSEKGEHIGEGFNIIAGGLTGIKMETKPRGWSKASKHYRDVYFPQKNLVANKEILAKIEALPKVYTDDINALVGFEDQTVGRNVILMPNFYWRDDFIVFTMNSGCIYTPMKDIEEITGSEFKNYKDLCEG